MDLILLFVFPASHIIQLNNLLNILLYIDMFIYMQMYTCMPGLPIVAHSVRIPFTSTFKS